MNEILIPKPNDKELEKQTRSNHFSELDETAPSVSEYKNEVFELGDLVHEAIAISIPFNPKPEQNDDGSCKVCLKTTLTDAFMYDEKLSIETQVSPFNVLKDVKIKTPPKSTQ